MNNKRVRIAMLENGIRQWELAELLGISEAGISRKLRHELPDDEQRKMVELITGKNEPK